MMINMQPGMDSNIFQYRGSSMTGTFRPGDMLVTRDVAFAAIRPGDVVAFRAPGRRRRRQPDRPPRARPRRRRAGDPWRRLCATGRRPRAGHGPGGPRGPGPAWTPRPPRVGRLAGRWWARALRLRRRLLALGRLPYRWLRASGLVRRVWRPAVTQISVMTTQGLVIKYLCGARAVAEWRPETRAYRCQKPYDLVLDAPDREYGVRSRK